MREISVNLPQGEAAECLDTRDEDVFSSTEWDPFLHSEAISHPLDSGSSHGDEVVLRPWQHMYQVPICVVVLLGYKGESFAALQRLSL